MKYIYYRELIVFFSIKELVMMLTDSSYLETYGLVYLFALVFFYQVSCLVSNKSVLKIKPKSCIFQRKIVFIKLLIVVAPSNFN